MKDRSFLYELKAYLLYVKVGENIISKKKIDVKLLRKDTGESVKIKRRKRDFL